MYSWMFKLYSMKSWTPDRDQDRPMDIMLLILASSQTKLIASDNLTEIIYNALNWQIFLFIINQK